jgi:hypothetical protein
MSDATTTDLYEVTMAHVLSAGGDHRRSDVQPLRPKRRKTMPHTAEWKVRLYPPRLVPAESANCALPTAWQWPDFNQLTSPTESDLRIARP